MAQRVPAFLTAFVVGLAGFLLACALRPSGGLDMAAAVAIGALAGVVARREVGLAGLVLGIGLGYPVALGLGLIAFVGENWYIAAALIVGLAVAGFAGALWVTRWGSRARAG